MSRPVKPTKDVETQVLKSVEGYKDMPDLKTWLFKIVTDLGYEGAVATLIANNVMKKLENSEQDRNEAGGAFGVAHNPNTMAAHVAELKY